MTPISDFFPVPAINGVPAHRLHYLDWGDIMAKQVIIAVHGLTRNAHDFDVIAAKLAEQGKRVIALDMPGRGLSEPLADSSHYHYGTYIADCLAFLNSFHLRGVDWLGTSMGGLIGMMIAASDKKRIRKLVMNDIGAFVPKDALIRILQGMQATPTHFTSYEDASASLRQKMATFGISSEAQWQMVEQHSIMAVDGGGFRLAYDARIIDPLMAGSPDYSHVADVNLASLWEPLRLPTLILRGEHSDILQRETVSAMRNTNLQAQSVELGGVGHAPMLMDDGQIMPVLQFFNS